MIGQLYEVIAGDNVMNSPIPHLITRIKQETPVMKTLEFQSKIIAERSKPGQFLMVWIPGLAEKPMGFSYIGGPEDHWTIGITVARVGKATETLQSFQEGDLLGLRGPLGNGFNIERSLGSELTGPQNIMLVGGGCGTAALRPLIYVLLAHGAHLTCIGGAKTKEELLFREEFEHLSKTAAFTYLACTDDGSWEFHGTSAQRMELELTQRVYHQIFTCGPELMMKQVFDLAQQNQIPIQASLADRIIKCAVGLCGQCILDPLGVRLCIEGPVFSEVDLAQLSDFGLTTRNKAGKRISLQ